MVDRGHLALGALLCVAAAFALAGWIRALDPGPPQPDRYAQTLAGVRQLYELQGDTVQMLGNITFVGPTAYATVKTANMPTALRVRVPQQRGWRVLDVTPIRTTVVGP
jgi:hypothetical protein